MLEFVRQRQGKEARSNDWGSCRSSARLVVTDEADLVESWKDGKLEMRQAANLNLKWNHCVNPCSKGEGRGY